MIDNVTNKNVSFPEFSRIIVLSLFSVFYFSLLAQSQTDILSYIDCYRDIALRHEYEYGIPASITLAQGILESGAGKSVLATKANNHFGIKAHKGWSGNIFYSKDDEEGLSKFRVYSSVNESFIDHAKVLISSPRYRKLFDKSIYDYRGWANGLQNAGYASSPTYAKALIGYIEAYNLYQLDGGVKLKKGKTTYITKTITIEELETMDDIVSDTNEDSEEEKIVKETIRKYVTDINDVRCTILNPGETLASVALRYDIPKEKLLEFNETTNENDIGIGDIVYIERKKKKYNGAQDYYIARDGDSLYKISQMFGMSLNTLLKLNGMSLFSNLSKGQRIILK